MSTEIKKFLAKKKKIKKVAEFGTRRRKCVYGKSYGYDEFKNYM